MPLAGASGCSITIARNLLWKADFYFYTKFYVSKRDLLRLSYYWYAGIYFLHLCANIKKCWHRQKDKKTNYLYCEMDLVKQNETIITFQIKCYIKFSSFQFVSKNLNQYRFLLAFANIFLKILFYFSILFKIKFRRVN